MVFGQYLCVWAIIYSWASFWLWVRLITNMVSEPKVWPNIWFSYKQFPTYVASKSGPYCCVFPRCWAWTISIGPFPIHVSRRPINVPHRLGKWSLGNIYVYGQSSTLELTFRCELGSSLISIMIILFFPSLSIYINPIFTKFHRLLLYFDCSYIVLVTHLLYFYCKQTIDKSLSQSLSITWNSLILFSSEWEAFSPASLYHYISS